jgi:glycosyltransferase involved in cell wall biosynthesis
LTQQPIVSVVVPVYNGAATIATCIEALLAQTYPSQLTEIIVVDNNSTDGTPDLVSRYPVTLLHERAIQTSYAARNRGIEHARGELVALTDADCTPRPDWLSRLIEPFSNGEVGAVLGVVADSPPQSLVEEFTGRVQPFSHPDRKGLKSLITGNVAIRRSAFAIIGLFEERLPTAGDIDFGWRLQLEARLKVVDAPEARVLHRHRACLSGVFAQFRRYGLSEILLTTLYRGQAGSVTGRDEAWRMANQFRALLSYVASIVTRFISWPWHRFERRYLLWPLFLLVVESGNVMGKLDGLLATRCYRRNPFRSARPIARTTTSEPTLRPSAAAENGC